MELIDLCEECTRIGLNLAEMAAQLDILCDHTTDRSAKRQRGLADAASQSGPLLDVSHFDAARAQLLLTCAGTYCTVLGRSAMALEHFRAATSMVATTPPAAAQLGLAKSLLALGHRQQALSVVLSFWRSPQQSHLDENVAPSRAQMQLAFLLATFVEEQPMEMPPLLPPDALLLLRRLSPLLTSPACSAVEKLAARWLPSQVPVAARGGGEYTLLSEPFVQAALTGSRAFGTYELEPLVSTARRQLLFILLRHLTSNSSGCGGGGGSGGGSRGGGSPTVCLPPGCFSFGGGGSCATESSRGSGGSGSGTSGRSGEISVNVSNSVCGALPPDGGGTRNLRIEAAAMLGCWCHFAGFCLEEGSEEAQAVTAACVALEAGLSSPYVADWPLSHHNEIAYLAAVGMYIDLSELRAVEVWLREPELAAEVGRRLQAAGLPRVWAMLEQQVVAPRQRARRAEQLWESRLTPVPSDALREFDFHGGAPRWHAADVFGVVQAPSIAERLRWQYRHFAWPHGEASEQHSILVVGAGDGHAVAHALQAYQHVAITALDPSARALAACHYQLHTNWPLETERRVRFAVADSLALPSAGLHGAEMVLALGVLHRLPRADAPRVLYGLASALKEGGVLQLSSYSTLGLGAWCFSTRRLLHRLSPGLVSPDGHLTRQPAPYELRELRAAIMALGRQSHAGSEARGGGGGGRGGVGGGDGGGDGGGRGRGLGDVASAGVELSAEELAAHAHVVRSSDFYSAAGCRELLLLHPCECSFTLLDLRALLDGAGLDVLGVAFAGREADKRAREAYIRSAATSGYAPGDSPDRQIDLSRWHALEEAQPDIFGRTHVLFAQKRMH